MQTLTLIIGILSGLVWKRRTGFSCGGIITPAILALYGSPQKIIMYLVFGIVLAPVVSSVSELLDLYGTERTGAAMIAALILRQVLPGLGAGFVVPGLIACDVNRQGVLMTVCGVVSCTLESIMILEALKVIV